MKIAFLSLHWNCTGESGVLKKVRSQVECWTAMGHEVKLFLFSYYPDIWDGLARVPVQHTYAPSPLARAPKIEALVNQLSAWQPDIAYLRLNTYYPALERLVSSTPTVLEMNTNYNTQYRSHKSKAKYFYYLLTRDRIPKKSSGMVFVAREIASAYPHYEQPTLVLGNGIDLACYQPLSTPTNPFPHLVFLGSPGVPWNGIDKILWLASKYRKWQFDLIGPVPADLDQPLPPNVSAHGMLAQGEYEPILEHADIAVGSLALHRKGMDEASPLKVREYLAYGLPTIIAYHDTDFERPAPFLLQIPNTPDNVVTHAAAIERFVAEWHGKRVPREEIAHLDLKNKERERLSFFRQVLQIRGGELAWKRA